VVKKSKEIAFVIFL